MQIITFELAPEKTNYKCENLFYILFCILILVQQFFSHYWKSILMQQLVFENWPISKANMIFRERGKLYNWEAENWIFITFRNLALKRKNCSLVYFIGCCWGWNRIWVSSAHSAQWSPKSIQNLDATLVKFIQNETV